MSARTMVVRAIAAALAVGLAGSAAFGQAPPAPPATARPAAPSASSAPTATAAANTSSAPGASAAPSGSGSALPPGHPPTGSLPPGHPPTGQMPPGHPPTGQMPPGHPPTGDRSQENPHGGDRRSELFNAPPDTAEDDASLPPGTIVLALRDANEQPVASTDVTLGVIHSTVATGEARERKSGTTGADGTMRWDGLARGSATSYRASVARGAARFGTEPFRLDDRAGKRVVLHVYAVTHDVEEALVGTQGVVYLALRESSIFAQNLFMVYNLGRVAWVPQDETVTLPEGYKTFNRPDSMDGVGIDEVNGKGLMRGTISPGQHQIEYTYSIPLDQTETQTIKMELPPQMAQMRVMVEASKNMGATVKGFPAPRKTRNRDGKRVLVTEKMFSRTADGRQTVEIVLSGLPTAGPWRWVAVLLSLGAVAGGLAYARQRRDQTGPDEETRRDLVDAREALLGEIVELERAHRAGEIGPKTYQRIRDALLDALNRLVSKISEAAPKKRAKSRAADADE